VDDYTKFIAINGSILAAVLALILFPDVLFGLFFQLLHLLMEFAHILFEFIESTLDHFIEHLFHTDLHETQVIVFYIIVSIALVGIYGLSRTLPRACRRFKNNVFAFFDWEKTICSDYWLGLTVTQKIRLSLTFVTGLYLLSFLFF